MKEKLLTIIPIILIFLGVVFLLYPTFSDYYNQQKSAKAVAYYAQEVDGLEILEYERMMQSAIEYNNLLHSEELQLINGDIYNSDYSRYMNVWNGMMGYVHIDNIDVLLPIYHGTSVDVLRKGVGHIEGTSLPTGQLGNHTVLTAHTGLPQAELFTHLLKIEIGDRFELLILNETFVYEVIETQVVLPNQVNSLGPEEGRDLVTLVTCTPYGINSHRLLVHAERIEIDEMYVTELNENIQLAIQNKEEEIKVEYLAINSIIFVLILVFMGNMVLVYKIGKGGSR